MVAQLRELQERAVCSQQGVAELQSKLAELVKQDYALTRLQSKGAVDPALFGNATTASPASWRKPARSSVHYNSRMRFPQLWKKQSAC